MATPYLRSGGAAATTGWGGGGPTTATTGTLLANSSCVAAVVQGRGAAQSEVGVAAMWTTRPVLVLAQLSDTRTFTRAVAKVGYFNPGEILVPLDAGAGCKLNEELADKCPHASLTQVQRKYFSEAKGMQTIRHLCSPDFASVEIHLQYKYYR